jgi:hypothetical protein
VRDAKQKARPPAGLLRKGSVLSALFDLYIRSRMLRPDVIRARPNQPVVIELFDNVR